MTSPWTAPGADPASGPERRPDTAPRAGAPDAPPRADGASLAERRELVSRAPLFPLRPLGLGEILGAATRIYRDRPRIVLTISAAVFAVAFVLTVIISGASFVPLAGSLEAAIETPDASVGVTGDVVSGLPTIFASLASGLLTMIAVQLVTVAVAPLALGQATERPLSDGEAWQAVRRRGGAAVLAGLLLSLAMMLALAVLGGLGALPLALTGEATWWTVVPLLLGILASAGLMLWLWARTALVTPAIAIEGLGPIAGLRRSFQLTAGQRLWRVLGISLLLALLASVVSQTISSVTGVVGMIAYVGILVGSQMSQLLLGMIVLLVITMLGAYVASLLAQPFLAAGATALYADQRMRHEAWDVELTRRAQQARADAAAREDGTGPDRHRG